MGLPRPPGGPITHPSARHQPLQADPKQPNHATGLHRRRRAHLQGLLQRKQFLCATGPAWKRRGPRDREIAALNRQIDHLPDHWQTSDI
jgi:hypothetical protein